MTDTEINKRIAEYMGLDVREVCPKRYIVRGNNICDNLPDYCNDLNAVWEVEEKLKAKRINGTYTFRVTDIIGSKFDMFSLIHATARQKCEAIIKVVGEK